MQSHYSHSGICAAYVTSSCFDASFMTGFFLSIKREKGGERLRLPGYNEVKIILSEGGGGVKSRLSENPSVSPSCVTQSADLCSQRPTPKFPRVKDVKHGINTETLLL